MWAYVFYFMYLYEKDEKDYTALEMHVAKRVRHTYSLVFLWHNEWYKSFYHTKVEMIHCRSDAQFENIIAHLKS